MSQGGNAETSSSKRAYRKGKPLSATERQQAAVARKRSTHKEIKIFVNAKLKDCLVKMCENEGITQAEMIEKWIESEAKRSDLIP